MLEALDIAQEFAPYPVPALYTFNSPRVGNPDFAMYVNQQLPFIRRVVYKGDPVSHFPPKIVFNCHTLVETALCDSVAFVFTWKLLPLEILECASLFGDIWASVFQGNIAAYAISFWEHPGVEIWLPNSNPASTVTSKLVFFIIIVVVKRRHAMTDLVTVRN
ncbi:991_t:CDS:2 [Dentiscutata erythropus]|uniref:991_t:CDS:1 n=1 Tax=Dentiscutata erythropus TaxID=1348616 RepID=A0A9N9CFR0_9GLOM|nr:991_t:CDS:2 [Dentiscutata erythropus]